MQFVSDVTVQLLVERPQFLPRVFHLADKVVGAVVGHQHVCSVDEAEHSVGGTKQWQRPVVVVAQLTEQSLQIPQVRGSNPVIGKF